MAFKKISIFWIEDQLDELIDGGWDVLKAELAKLRVELEGERPFEAKTVEEAERMLAKFNIAEGQKPDVILLDLMLSQDDEDYKNKRVDMDAGYLIWSEVRYLKKWSDLVNIPIIIITARGHPEYMDQMLADPATHWLSKPANPNTVARAIAELIPLA